MTKTKKSKQQRKHQSPNRDSEKKRIRKEKRLEPVKEVVQELILEPELGNNGEPGITPEEMSYMEDTRKPEPTPVFDAKKYIEDLLKRHGV